MIRKQFYIDKVHEQKLKRLAGERGVTEAEVIREAIDDIGSVPTASQRIPDPEAVHQFFAFLRELEKRPTIPAPRWTRDSLYEERIGRWIKS
jgi:hypothetical protein